MGTRPVQPGLGRDHGGDYRIRLRDFGPIERADVEFRPLTVFVGPSNSGKTVEQLQAGADEASQRAAKLAALTFRPVIALHRFKPKAIRRMTRQKVVFKGEREPIRLVMCGDRLAAVLDS